MSEKRGFLSRIFRPKESACCGVQFENPDSEAEPRPTPGAAPSPSVQRTSCCGTATKQTSDQDF